MKLFEITSAGQITPQNVEEKYLVGKVLVDNEKGIGNVPFNREVAYKGFVGFMKPSKFLFLAKESDDGKERSEKMKDAFGERGIGNPFFVVVVSHDQSTMKIVDHDGRARMSRIKKINGDEPFPVHFIIRGQEREPGYESKSIWDDKTKELRAKGLMPEFFENLRKNKVTGEAGHESMLGCDKFFWMGKQV